MVEFLFDGPKNAAVTLLLAHGAGAPMDSDWMNGFAEGAGKAGVRVARFEFSYMAARRQGQRKPPPKAETLMDEYRAAIAVLKARTPLVIGGKSMGGRVASMIADEAGVAGLVCLGYPFHPPGQAEKLRTAHLEKLKTRTLICQGTRDPFGTREEVGLYGLSKKIGFLWLEDGDHDFRPRLKVSGLTLADNLALAIAKTAAFAGKTAAN